MAVKTTKLGRPFGSSAENTRKEILLAAAQQFNDRGYTDASMARIAAVAGLTGAAIYNHFDSKEALFGATVESFILDYNTMLSEAVSIDGNWKEKLRNITITISNNRQSGQNFPLISSVVQSALKREPEKFERIRELRNQSVTIFRDLVSDAVAAGEMPENIDLEITGELLMAFAVQGTNTVANYRGEADISKQLIESFLALLKI